MYANLKPFSLMGLPNKVAPSEKESHATKKGDLRDKQDTILHKPEADKSVLAAPPPLKMRVRCSRGVDEDGDGDGGCTTPKAEERGEVVLPKCPPPPRKPKSVPVRKRKNEERVLLDLSSEIESMFPDNILRDFMCGKIKKVRTQTQ